MRTSTAHASPNALTPRRPAVHARRPDRPGMLVRRSGPVCRRPHGTFPQESRSPSAPGEDPGDVACNAGGASGVRRAEAAHGLHSRRSDESRSRALGRARPAGRHGRPRAGRRRAGVRAVSGGVEPGRAVADGREARGLRLQRVGLRGHLRTGLALIVGHGTAHITPFRRLSGAETPMGSRQPNKLLP